MKRVAGERPAPGNEPGVRRQYNSVLVGKGLVCRRPGRTMRFLEDERLYFDTEHCLRFLRGLAADPAPPAAERERFHFYWQGDFSRKAALAVKSFLATQDLKQTEGWLWLDAADGYPGHEQNPNLRPLLEFLKVRRFDPEEEAAGTPLAAGLHLYHEPGLTTSSNFARLVVLYKHGGAYFDLDTLFLRDLRQLWRVPGLQDEFCSRWSAHKPYGNNAVLRLRPHSAAAEALQARCLLRQTCWPTVVVAFDETPPLDLLVLPCVFFDPLWPHRDRRDRYRAAPFDQFPDFFRPFSWRFPRRRGIRSLGDFFPGAFTYHWHNCWDAPEARNSYFGMFEAEVDDALRQRLGLRGLT
jgi:hypothetical protein